MSNQLQQNSCLANPYVLPGEFLASRSGTDDKVTTQFVEEMKRHFHNLKKVPGFRHGKRYTLVFQDLKTCDHVFVRHQGIKKVLQMPYDGPFAVISRPDKTFKVIINGKDVTLSIDRLKLACIIAEEEPKQQVTPIPRRQKLTRKIQEETFSNTGTTTRSGRRV
ncbi:uncharacterized protein LOC117178376 [Belonocnema kinseyi]|uniref:uncharacterized protein LOC117178376 n=1 Tax=Belonocnema kinseyi TaxID=2817044 RepID=UPI00143D735B|nr:uncharacterized protein LOC117178376 [Belonocnema kinseyi]